MTDEEHAADGFETRPTADTDMTETSTTDTDTSTTDANESTAADEGIDRLPTDRLRAVLDRVGLAALILLALIAGWSAYRQTGVAIRTWLDPAYQSIALAAFNFAILLVALAGVAHQLSRIRAGE